MAESARALIKTVPERCRVCYTCVRECPAKAIRISKGQAEIIADRCIRCGNCVRVCSQRAKEVIDDVPSVVALLASDARVAALVAPSFPAEFADFPHRHLVGKLRAVGFDLVVEVGFGADLVARAYDQLFHEAPQRRFIETTCPAIVSYVEQYHPLAVDLLAPIVSPMIAAARAVREMYGQDTKTVFLGPCIAKKGEASLPLPNADRDPHLGEVEAVLTFSEVHRLFAQHDLAADQVSQSEFDPPWSGLGALFPLSRGLLQAAQISEDLVSGDVVSADGRTEFVEAIKEFESGALDARLLQVLCCEGCIMGAGMTTDAPMFTRRSRVSRYVREFRATGGDGLDDEMRQRLLAIDLSRGFTKRDRRVPSPKAPAIDVVLARMGKMTPDDELNCGACGYETCRDHAVAILEGLAESEMCLPYTIGRLRSAVDELGASHEALARTQEALMHSERLASMGQLAAGIAHEVNNPLGVVLMYAHMLADEAPDGSERKGDLQMIVDQAGRCKKIVAGLLNFARQNKVTLTGTELRPLLEETLRVLPPPPNVTVRLECPDGLDADLDRDQIVQVLVNLTRNAIDAMPDGGALLLGADEKSGDVRLCVSDTGTGIPQHVKAKVFEPFFTTKEVGKGTGLGLSMTYGIVKMHCGDIRLETNADVAAGPTGTTFTVTVPRRRRAGAAFASAEMVAESEAEEKRR